MSRGPAQMECTLMGEGRQVPPETAEQIREKIFNPTPAITHCPCGHSLGKCVVVTVTSACKFIDMPLYGEFLRTVPEWFLRVLAKADQ